MPLAGTFRFVENAQTSRKSCPFMTIANQITIARILMIPLFVMMAIYYGRSVQRGMPEEWERYAAILIFVIAAASDGLDGFLARRLNQVSRLGIILDPLADKGLLLAAIITLAFSNWHYEFPIWFPVLVIARDIVVIGGSLLVHYLNGSVQIRPNWTGKAATFFQMIAVTGVMLQLPYEGKLLGYPILLLDLLVLFAGIFTLISGAGYILNGIRQLQTGTQTHA